MENVTTSRLVAEVARKTGFTRKAVQATVDAMIETIAETLERGGRVELRNLASFSVEETAPRVGRNPRTGKEIVIPKSRRVRTRIAAAVKRAVAERHLSTGEGILVAGPGDPWADEIVSRLRAVGYAVSTGPTLEAAVRASGAKPEKLAFVMVGPSIDDLAYAGLARALKLDPSMSMLPVVLGRTDISALARPKGVRIMPDGSFDSPATAEDLVRTEAERWREEKQHLAASVTLRSPSDVTSVEKLKSMLEEFYKEALADETEAYKTLSAFREAIDNAAHHGNADSPERYLTVTLMQDDERLVLDVKDEGRGFDHDRFVEAGRSADAAATARERVVRGEEGGLGMKLMTECTDELRYGEDGSRLLLMKRRGAGGEA